VVINRSKADSPAIVAGQSDQPLTPVGDGFFGDFGRLNIARKFIEAVQIMAIVLDCLEASTTFDLEIVEEFCQVITVHNPSLASLPDKRKLNRPCIAP